MYGPAGMPAMTNLPSALVSVPYRSGFPPAPFRTTCARSIGSPVTELRTSPSTLAGGRGAGGCAKSAAVRASKATGRWPALLRIGRLRSNLLDVPDDAVGRFDFDLVAARVDLLHRVLPTALTGEKLERIHGARAILAGCNALDGVLRVRGQLAAHGAGVGLVLHQRHHGHRGIQAISVGIQHAAGELSAGAADHDLDSRAVDALSDVDRALVGGGAIHRDALDVCVLRQAVDLDAIASRSDGANAEGAVAIQFAALYGERAVARFHGMQPDHALFRRRLRRIALDGERARYLC